MEGEPSDRALATDIVRDRDEAAFRQLYRRHSPALFRVASRLTGDGGAVAQDVVHDTWLRAVEHLDRFDWRSTLRTWLTGILLNRVREEHRRSGRERSRFSDEPVDPSAPPEPLDERLDLEEAIARLPKGYREAVVLHDIEGFRHEEIAALLGIDIGTSKSQLSRARRSLRRWLE